MAYPKHSTLALIALVLIATTSLAKSQEPEQRPIIPIIPLPNVTIVGVVTCGLPIVPRPPFPIVNVTLSCDGGRTAVVPPVTTTAGGLYSITVNANVFDPIRCFVYVRTPVVGCPRLATGEVLRAPIIAVSPVLRPFPCIIQLFITVIFVVVRIG